MFEWNPYEFTTQQSWDDVTELSSERVQEVLVVGDIHGTKAHLTTAIDLAVDLDVGAIVQVGDFWLSDRHGALHRSKQAVIATRRPLHLGGSLWWAWRGSVWNWDGLRCVAFGGAVSPDRRNPAVRGWRWPREAATRDDLNRFLANVDSELGGTLDVLFTHDAPAQVRNLKGGMRGIPLETWQAINQMRLLLAEAVDRAQPRLVIRGHWHRSHRERISAATESVGLANDGRRHYLAWLTADPELHVSYMT